MCFGYGVSERDRQIDRQRESLEQINTNEILQGNLHGRTKAGYKDDNGKLDIEWYNKRGLVEGLHCAERL